MASDYISREAAIALTDQHCFESCYDAEWMEEALKDIPAADVRPVVRAHWTDHRTLEHDGEWYCSACGKEITIYMGADRPDRYAFCPNCGADMRGKTNVKKKGENK